MWHESHVMCQVSCSICHVSYVMCHMSCLICHVSYVICHMLLVTSHLSFDHQSQQLQMQLLRTHGYSRVHIDKQANIKLPPPPRPAHPGEETKLVCQRPLSGQHYCCPGHPCLCTAWTCLDFPTHNYAPPGLPCAFTPRLDFP